MIGSTELLFEVRSQSSGRWISTSPADQADTFMSTASGVMKRKVCSFVKLTIASFCKCTHGSNLEYCSATVEVQQIYHKHQVSVLPWGF